MLLPDIGAVKGFTGDEPLIRIVININDSSALNIMKIPGYLIIGLLALILVAAAGCTAPQPATVQTPTAAPQASHQTATTAAIRTAPAAGIDTTINVRFNELACISVQEHLGSTYLYPDQKFQA